MRFYGKFDPKKGEKYIYILARSRKKKKKNRNSQHKVNQIQR